MIIDLLAGFASGVLGAMGLGGGAVLLIYLALFKDVNQFSAQGINLIFFIPIAIFSVVMYAIKKQIKWKTVLWLVAAGLIGAGVGVWVSKIIGTDIVAKIFGGLLAVAGAFQIISAFKHTKNKTDS